MGFSLFFGGFWFGDRRQRPKPFSSSAGNVVLRWGLQEDQMFV